MVFATFEKCTLRFLLITIFATASLISCSSGGGGDGGGTRALTVSTGQFIDSIAAGIQYSYPSTNASGITDANGNFPVDLDATVEFHIGDISLGSASATLLMSPVNLGSSNNATNQITTNITRFLQVIDDDGNSSNGIQITSTMRDLASGMTVNFDQTPTNFENDGNVQTVVSTLTAATMAGARLLTSISVADAQNHLSNSLSDAIMSQLDTFTGTSLSDFTNCVDAARDTVARGSITISFINPVEPYSFSGSGSFSVNAGGVNVREDMSISGTFLLDGTVSGSISSDAYQNGSYVGSGNSSYSGSFSQSALLLDIPTIFLPQYGTNCYRNGQIVVTK